MLITRTEKSARVYCPIKVVKCCKILKPRRIRDGIAAVFLWAQMMGDCRAGHIQQGGDVQHTFLVVAEYPEDAQPGAVTYVALLG